MDGFRRLLTVLGVTLCACGEPTVVLMATGQAQYAERVQ